MGKKQPEIILEKNTRPHNAPRPGNLGGCTDVHRWHQHCSLRYSRYRQRSKQQQQNNCYTAAHTNEAHMALVYTCTAGSHGPGVHKEAHMALVYTRTAGGTAAADGAADGAGCTHMGGTDGTNIVTVQNSWAVRVAPAVQNGWCGWHRRYKYHGRYRWHQQYTYHGRYKWHRR